MNAPTPVTFEGLNDSQEMLMFFLVILFLFFWILLFVRIIICISPVGHICRLPRECTMPNIDSSLLIVSPEKLGGGGGGGGCFGFLFLFCFACTWINGLWTLKRASESSPFCSAIWKELPFSAKKHWHIFIKFDVSQCLIFFICLLIHFFTKMLPIIVSLK